MTDYKKLAEDLLRCQFGNYECEQCSYYARKGKFFCDDDLHNDAAAAIEELQAQVPKHGEWVAFDLTFGRSVYSCTVCQHSVEAPTEMGKPIFNYCPNCGAKMGVQE